MPQQNLPDFAGKVLILNCGDSDQGVVYLEDPRFEVQCERLFVSGTCPAGITPGLDGICVAVAWDSVRSYYVFESAGALRDSVARWGDKK